MIAITPNTGQSKAINTQPSVKIGQRKIPKPIQIKVNTDSSMM